MKLRHLFPSSMTKNKMFGQSFISFTTYCFEDMKLHNCNKSFFQLFCFQIHFPFPQIFLAVIYSLLGFMSANLQADILPASLCESSQKFSPQTDRQSRPGNRLMITFGPIILLIFVPEGQDQLANLKIHVNIKLHILAHYDKACNFVVEKRPWC
jgi:hypothetical protein